MTTVPRINGAESYPPRSGCPCSHAQTSRRRLLALALMSCLANACSGQKEDPVGIRTRDGGAVDAGMTAEEGGAPDAGADDLDGGDTPLDADSADGDVDGSLDSGQTDAGEVIVNGLYVSPTGLDQNAGSEVAPLLTLARAASMATAGDTIVLLDGLYDGTTQPTFTRFNSQRIDVAEGVTVRALHAGAAVLRGDKGYLLRFTGSGTVRGLVLDGFATAISASSGQLIVRETKLLSGGSNSNFPIELTNTARATITPPSDGSYIGGPNPNGFVSLRNSSEATITGGRLSGATSTGVTCNVLVSAADTSKLTVDGVTAEANTQDGVWASGQADVLIRNSTFRNTLGVCQGSILLEGSAKLRVENSTITETSGNGILVRNNASSNVTITLTDTTLSKLGYGLFADFTDQITLTAVRGHFDENTRSGLYNRGAGTMELSACSFDRNGEQGLQVESSATHVFLLKARGCSFQDNVRDGVRLGGDPASSFDLGTVGEPGNNTLDGNSVGTTSYSNLHSLMPSAFRVFAVGNTWTAGAQGADASGRYSATGAGASRDELGSTPVGDRTNYNVSAAGSILRLAENL